MVSSAPPQWRGDADPEDFFVELPAAAARAFERVVEEHGSRRRSDGSCEIPDGAMSELRDHVQHIRRALDAGPGLVFLRPINRSFDDDDRVAFSWCLARSLGSPVPQDAEGRLMIQVYDRDRTRRMADGARYHQTHEGGYIHTDNVNLPETWEYLVFSCIRSVRAGGESIFINGAALHELLRAEYPEVLRALEQPFWWEHRGFSDGLYAAPIITYDDHGRPRFRYLRAYLESAHAKAGDPLTDLQRYAMDVLDALLAGSDLQLRCRFKAGESMIARDERILHGRTVFADPIGTHEDGTKVLGRLFTRLWVRAEAL
ncbi:MAG: TauD/TfdA family dioxygenase [Byssovorax sp.]